MTQYCVITGTMQARTAVHLGAGVGNETTDALIRRDGAGHPLIPGTAIAGALRALLTRLVPHLGVRACKALGADDGKACGCEVCHLFGDVNPTDEENSPATASRLLVFDAKLKDGTASFIRDSVGIDRATGAAARAGAVKFDLEAIPQGCAFELRLELRGTDERGEQLLAAGLAEWQAGRAWLGGRVARGLGAFTLQDVRCVGLDLNQQAQLMNFLREDYPWKKGAQEVSGWLSQQVGQIEIQSTDAQTVARCWLNLTFALQADGPLLTNDATSGCISGFDHAPLTSAVADWAKPVLPGAGLRGVLRSHAERIARTLATSAANNTQEFLRHCPACHPLASRLGGIIPSLESCDSLFKNRPKHNNKAATEKEKDNQPQLCLACRLFGSTQRGSRLIVEDAPFSGEKPEYKMQDFLAIDRFTGGGADQFKFDALALWRPAFRVRMHLENPEPWELGWLVLVLRDLRDGWLSVGFGAAKGFGRVHIPTGDWEAQLGFLGDDGFGLPVTTSSGVYRVAALNNDTQLQWLTQVEHWVEAFKKEIKKCDWGIERCDDTYFGKVDHLYPRKETL
ncbi:MAG: RAMP superfamily CRISPR-associated protein [Acidobacteriota bacterium]